MRTNTQSSDIQRLNGARPRRLKMVALALVVSLCGSFVATGPAQASPEDGQEPIGDITRLAELDAAIAALELEREAVLNEVLTSAEDYNAAVEEFQSASGFADYATEQAQKAGEKAQESRRFIARMARESTRTSGVLDALGAFFVSNGLEDLVAETQALEVVDEITTERFQQFQADKLVAEILQDKAKEASQKAREKRDASTQALNRAQLAEAQVERKMAEAEARRGELVAQAAAARRTSLEEEERRQEELAAQRAEAERQAALARIAREEEAVASNNVEVDEAPRPSSTPTASQQPDAEDQEGVASPAPSRTQTSPSSIQPTRDPEPSREPEPSRSPEPSKSPSPTREPSPTPTPTSSSPKPTETPKPTSTPKPTQPTADPYGLGKGVSSGSAAKGNAAVAAAKTHLGKPYLLGGAGPDRFDCSGLTSVAWAAAGVNITRTSRSQYKRVLKIKLSDMRPGDLIFWGNNAAANDADSISHVAMYVGGGMMIESPRPGKTVLITPVRYDSRIMPFAGRP